MKCIELQLLNIHSALTTCNSQERQYCQSRHIFPDFS